MLLALGLTYLLPFELLLLSYVVLGPAHYATEISWLHDRKYFLPQRGDVAAAARGCHCGQCRIDRTLFLRLCVRLHSAPCAWSCAYRARVSAQQPRATATRCRDRR